MKVTLKAPLATASGKIFGNDSTCWVKTINGKVYTFHRNNERDYTNHPKTEEEQKTQSRIGEASKAWATWQPTDEERAQFERDYQAQLQSERPIKKRRNFFISCEMKRLKQEGPLRAIPENNLQDWGTHR